MTYKISAWLGLVDTLSEIANLSFQLKKDSDQIKSGPKSTINFIKKAISPRDELLTNHLATESL